MKRNAAMSRPSTSGPRSSKILPSTAAPRSLSYLPQSIHAEDIGGNLRFEQGPPTVVSGAGMRAIRSTGRHLGFLFVLAYAAIAICSAATNKIYEVFLPIDASRTGASVSTDVEVTEGRLYIFYLVFHYKNEEQRERLAALVGDGGRLLPAGQYAHPGIVQRVHLTLTATTGSSLIEVHRNVQGVAAHELGVNLSGAYDRQIYAGVSRPGLYHMQITILQGRREFEGFESAVSVGVQPFTRMPSN